MSLRDLVHTYRRRRAFARILRTYGFKPQRWQLDLAIKYNFDRKKTS